MVPLVTAAHAGNSSLWHEFSEASYVPRTSITRKFASMCIDLPFVAVSICETFLVFALASALSCEGLVLRLFAFARTLSLTLVFGRNVFLFALASAFV